MSELRFENCDERLPNRFLDIIFSRKSLIIWFTTIVFYIAADFVFGPLDKIVAPVLIVLSLVILIRHEKLFPMDNWNVVFNEDGVRLDNNSSPDKESVSFRKGEFIIKVRATISPSSEMDFDDDDWGSFNPPVFMYRVVLQVDMKSSKSIYLKEFGPHRAIGKEQLVLNDRNLGKAQELRTQILDLIN